MQAVKSDAYWVHIITGPFVAMSFQRQMVLPVQVQKLHVDVAVQGVTVDFCGNSQVMAYWLACHICLDSFPGWLWKSPPCQALQALLCA